MNAVYNLSADFHYIVLFIPFLRILYSLYVWDGFEDLQSVKCSPDITSQNIYLYAHYSLLCPELNQTDFQILQYCDNRHQKNKFQRPIYQNVTSLESTFLFDITKI
jgi:hypothetical protein